jgi:hypothetical protein
VGRPPATYPSIEDAAGTGHRTLSNYLHRSRKRLSGYVHSKILFKSSTCRRFKGDNKWDGNTQFAVDEADLTWADLIEAPQIPKVARPH